MKGRSGMLNRRLPSATLAEILVALALTSMVFVIGTMIWMNLNTQDAPHHVQRTRLVARELIAGVERTGRMGEETHTQGGVRFLKEVKPIHERRGLLQVTITCLDVDGQTLLTRSKIVKVHGQR